MIKDKKRTVSVSILVVSGILITYIQQVSPSPLLSYIRDEYRIFNNDALLNMSVSIIFPMAIAASLIGGIIEQKIGTGNLFVWTMLLVAAGVLINYVSVNYYIFLLGRILYGIGFGLGIPFIGSAIMKWYTPSQRGIMNTINGLFPFLGSAASFSLMAPLCVLFGGSWKHAIGIWGAAAAVILLLWLILSPPYKKEGEARLSQADAYEKRLYLNLWKRREIKLLCITFACDFLCYSYISVILPTYFMEIGNMSEANAGLLSAIAFPMLGIVGATLGGIVISKCARRKPVMAAGQLLKTAGISAAALGANVSFPVVILGICIFGLGNSLWIPGMYTVVMEQEDMTSTRVGASFALILSCGFLFGFVSPIIGGRLTNRLAALSGIAGPVASHAFGLQWSQFIFGFTNLIGFVCILLLKETGLNVLKLSPQKGEIPHGRKKSVK